MHISAFSVCNFFFSGLFSPNRLISKSRDIRELLKTAFEGEKDANDFDRGDLRFLASGLYYGLT